MKNLIDYAYQDNGTDFRKELYAAIHDKVAAAIEGKKQEIASNFMGQQEESVEESVELDEAKVSPTRGTRKIAAYHGEGGHTAEVRYSPEWKEYQVHHYKNGIHQGEGPISYHGHDKEDAHSTAKYECGIQPAVTKK